MQVELHDHLNHPVKLTASRVVIRDDFGNPIAFSIEYQPGHFRCFHAGDDDFVQQLRLHGIESTLVVTKLDHKTLEPIHRQRRRRS